MHGKEAVDNHQPRSGDDDGPVFPPEQLKDEVNSQYHVKMSNQLETRAQEWWVLKECYFLNSIETSIYFQRSYIILNINFTGHSLEFSFLLYLTNNQRLEHELLAKIISQLEHQNSDPTLKEMADRATLSPVEIESDSTSWIGKFDILLPKKSISLLTAKYGRISNCDELWDRRAVSLGAEVQ